MKTLRLILPLLLLASAPLLRAQAPDSTRTAVAAADEFSVIGELKDDFADLDTLPAPKRFKSLHMIGVRYSYDLCNVSSSPSIGESFLSCPLNFSLVFTYYHPLWDQLNLFGLQLGTKYGTMGYESQYSNWGEAVTYLKGFAGSQLKFDFSRYRVLVNAGTYYAYKLATDKPAGFDEYDIRHDYGVYAGGGFAIVLGPVELQLEGNYQFSFCSMYHTNKYSDLYWITAYPRNLSLSAGLFFHLW